MDTQKIFAQVLENFDSVIAQDSSLGSALWNNFVLVHPADIAQFLGNVEKEKARDLFTVLDSELKLSVFYYLSDSMKVFCLSFLGDKDREYLLGSLSIDELTDFFDELSDDELKKYLKLLHKKDREKVLSLMQFNPESAGGIMDTDVLTLMQEFTVEKSIQILQRLQPNRELHREIYVTTQDNELVGHINLEDLVLKHPKTRLTSILHKNELVVQVHEDREAIAHKMVHYQLMTVPVVGDNNIFLGIIPSETLVSIIEEEATEDVYKISALKPIKDTYFETPFMSLFFQRTLILIPLLLLQTFSTMIMEYYEYLLKGFLYSFSPMITSTGGNSSSQTSALVIQGMTLGEITPTNMSRFLWREFRMALLIGATLSTVGFIRIYITHGTGNIIGNVAVSVSLGIIVVISVMLGSFIPLLLKKLKWDPALAAGPFLATLMDVLGLFAYCYISKLILRS
jgi:magnesium transporter